MTPVLSPKKTWEGFVGGCDGGGRGHRGHRSNRRGARAAAATSWSAVGFGMTVGAGSACWATWPSR